MPSAVVLPMLGPTPPAGLPGAKCTIQQWHVKPGAWVSRGARLFSVATAQGLSEVVAEASGRLHVIAQTGATPSAGDVVAYLLASGEQPPIQMGASAPAAAAIDPPEPDAAPLAAPLPAATTDTGRVSPAVKRLAVEHQVDLSAVSGSGLGGRVLRDDVIRAAQAGPPHAASGFALASASGEALRSAREAGLTRDDDTVPSPEIAAPRRAPAQLVLRLEIDFTRAAALIGELEEVWAEHDRRPTPGHLVIRAVALTLRAHPALLRASGRPEASGVPLSFESFEGGSLVSTTMNDAGALSLEALVSRLNAAGDGDATDPALFTIVDLGSRGIDAVTPVLPASCVVSLGLGRVAQRPSFAGESAIERRAFLTLSLVTAPSVETVAAVDFLASLRQYLEQPARLLLA